MQVPLPEARLPAGSSAVDGPYAGSYLTAMRAIDLEDALSTTPFIPFEVPVDGKTISVGNRKHVILNLRKTLAVMVPDDHIHIVDIDRIRSLTLHRRKRKAA